MIRAAAYVALRSDTSLMLWPVTMKIMLSSGWTRPLPSIP